VASNTRHAISNPKNSHWKPVCVLFSARCLGAMTHSRHVGAKATTGFVKPRNRE
jgi:hypothetical protein